MRVRMGLIVAITAGWVCGCQGQGPNGGASKHHEDAGPRDSLRGDAGSESGKADAIDARIDRLFGPDSSFGSLNRELVRRRMALSPDHDGPFFMCNFIKVRARAEYPDGRDTDLSGAEANERYGQMVLPILNDIGARPVFVASVKTTLQTHDDVQWDQVAVVRYPSWAAFFEMLERADFRSASVHKVAGVAHTLVMPSAPIDLATPDGFLEVDLEQVPFPPSAEDTPIAIVHLYDYRDMAEYEDGRDTELSGEEAVGVYSQNRVEQGVVELGVRPGLWLDIQGALFGDPPSFDEFRVNLFPSEATFFHVAGMSEEAGIENRYAGLAHWYTLMTQPLINEYGYR